MFEVWWENSTLCIFKGFCLSEALWMIYVKERLKLGGFELLCENLPSKAQRIPWLLKGMAFFSSSKTLENKIAKLQTHTNEHNRKVSSQTSSTAPRLSLAASILTL